MQQRTPHGGIYITFTDKINGALQKAKAPILLSKFPDLNYSIKVWSALIGHLFISSQ